MPPAVRSAVISVLGAERLIANLDPETRQCVQVHGPTVIDGPPAQHRYVLFFSYADGPAVTKALRQLRASMSAAKDPVVNIAIDPDDAL